MHEMQIRNGYGSELVTRAHEVVGEKESVNFDRDCLMSSVVHVERANECERERDCARAAPPRRVHSHRFLSALHSPLPRCVLRLCSRRSRETKMNSTMWREVFLSPPPFFFGLPLLYPDTK